ncbi:nitronate monooxygenase [Glutamicibacter protophormiae]|uniref:Nitronate monooxygenase n=1 Tax=Glutamicibacter protophormiae TaxID=37930 RepID=A0ABS4XQR0_GLUPR|nr:nitronate monooxygenase [Glutamicibacter protophormiae]MBP2398053.1 nitronate monooxygenase [Glutamicibacter protophormiae]WPR64852.1 nitronate monooxygenase [Glutamicibacter protophormiae]WPR68348.1 nitronate monooxygenase [Glutamicibacter protophormiae]GGM02307.1 2-nitropropane dioxygenase [Glutamicibacter protophormiae]
MSDLQKLLGYRDPIFNAPMAGAAGGAMAAAVSAAGAVGMIGVSPTPTAEWIKTQASLVSEIDTPWGAGFMGWALEADLSPLESFLEYGPALVSISFGDVTRAAALAHEAGVLTAMQVGNAADLDRAMQDDIDIIIARGGEGGGHGRNESGTLPLLQRACAQRQKPVVAAGGIGTAAGIAAVLAAGADAAWIGTRFLSTKESSGHENLKAAVRASGLDDTVYTRAFDIAQQLPWAPEFGGRALANDFSRRYAADLDSLEATEDLRQRMVRARAEADVALAPVYAGQAVEFVQREETCAEVLAELGGFRRILAEAAQRFA